MVSSPLRGDRHDVGAPAVGQRQLAQHGAARLAHQAAGAAADREGDVRARLARGVRHAPWRAHVQRRTGTRRGGASSSGSSEVGLKAWASASPRLRSRSDTLSPTFSRTARASGMAAPLGQEQPLEGLDRIGRAGGAGQQHDAQRLLRLGQSLLGGARVPELGLGRIARHARAREIGVGQLELAGRHAGVGGGLVPADRRLQDLLVGRLVARRAGVRTAMSPSASAASGTPFCCAWISQRCAAAKVLLDARPFGQRHAVAQRREHVALLGGPAEEVGGPCRIGRCRRRVFLPWPGPAHRSRRRRRRRPPAPARRGPGSGRVGRPGHGNRACRD